MFSVTVSTTPPPPDPPVTIDSASQANPTTIESGESSTLELDNFQCYRAHAGWSHCELNANGSMSVSPTVTTVYDLRATGEGGPVTQSVTVTVTDPPPPPTDPEVVSFSAKRQQD